MTAGPAPSAEPARRLATGFGFVEGPVWLDEHDLLLFTDIPRNAVMQWREGTAVSTWMRPSHFAIGLTRRRSDGAVVACEHVTRSITALGVDDQGRFDGRRDVLARAVDGVPLNSTNDVIELEDGRILFTDPGFGVREEGGELIGYEQAMERPCDILAVGDHPDDATVVLSGMHRPNGLCASPDGNQLFITDSSTRVHSVFVVRSPGSDPEFLWEMPHGVPDGIKADTDANLWVAGGDGVYVITPEGEFLLHVPVPEMVTNLCFGGPDRQTLFMTATTSLYASRVSVRGS